MRRTSSRPDLAVSRSHARFLWRQAWQAGRGRLLVAMGAAAVAGLCAVPQAWLLAGLLENVLARTPLTLGMLLPVLALMLVRSACLYMGESRAAAVSAGVRVYLRHKLFGNLLELGPVALAHHTTGELAMTLVERIEGLDGYVARYIPQFGTVLVTLPCVLLAVVWISPWVAGILLGAGLLAPLLMAVVGILAQRASRRQYDQLGRLSHAFHDRLRHLELLRVFGAVARETAHLQEVADTFRQRTMRVLRLAFLSSTSLELLGSFAVAGAAIHLMHTDLPRHQALFVLLLVPDFFAPLRALLAGYHDRAAALAAVEGIQPLLEAPAMTPAPSFIRTLPEPVVPPSVDVQNVTVTYPERTLPAVQNLSLHVSPGEFLALAGPSGSGKSTVLSLLLGFLRPGAGQVAVGTHPLDALDPAQRARLFAWVGQRSRLFHGTLCENIRFGQRAATPAQVQQAAELAGLGELVAQLPEGLDTLVGEYGFGLSGGQAQRVALARAFLRQAPILLLDEPTAGLDRETAQALMETVRTLAQQRTVIMASHDPIALAAAERVVTLTGDAACAP